MNLSARHYFLKKEQFDIFLQHLVYWAHPKLHLPLVFRGSQNSLWVKSSKAFVRQRFHVIFITKGRYDFWLSILALQEKKNMNFWRF